MQNIKALTAIFFLLRKYFEKKFIQQIFFPINNASKSFDWKK